MQRAPVTCALLLASAAVTASDVPLAVTAGFAGEDWVRTDQQIGLTLSRRPAAEEGRLAIVVGRTDVTALFRGAGTALTYDAATLPLPPGETEVVVYLVPPSGPWTEVSRTPLRVLTEGGLRRSHTKPNVSLGLKAQVAEGHEPETNVPPRLTFTDLALQGALETEHARGATTFTTTSSVVGTSHQEDALRFAQQGEEAPLVDLGGYTAALTHRGLSLRVGDVTFGRQKYLTDQFATRGVLARGALGRVDLTLGALNGTRIVGWDNFLGVTRDQHRMATATLGVELLPRPGELRVEVTGVDGSVLPEASYNQGLLNDAVESQGAGARLEANLGQGRLRLLGGFTRSEYVNPSDPTLEQGTPLVPVAPETRDARYASVNLAVLQNLAVTPARSASLSVRYDHDRVDPLFGSLAAGTLRPDLETNTFGATAALGEVTLQAGHTRLRDNLGLVASILTTLTRRDSLTASLPLSALRRGAEPSVALPVLTYEGERTHQHGDGLPPNSDFSASHVPDQWSRRHGGAVTWLGTEWSAAYRLDRSEQDNRQPGRENADLDATVHGVSFSLALPRRVTLGLEASHEAQHNAETDRRDRLRRCALNFDWQPGRRLGLMGSVGWSDAEETTGASLNDALELDLAASWLVLFRGPGRGPQARLFVRGAHQRAHALDPQLALDDERTAWQLSVGFNLLPFVGVSQ
jgi:hypothetical protein